MSVVLAPGCSHRGLRSLPAGAMGRDEEGGELYIVRKVKDMRRNKDTKRWEFFVRWKGYPPEDNTWEGAQAFSDPGLYQPLLDKLNTLRKATQAKEGAALKALRNARWDLEEAIESIRKTTAAADALTAGKKRVASAEREATQPAREVTLPSRAHATAAPDVVGPNAAMAPTATTAPGPDAAGAPAAAAADAAATADAKEEEQWLQMLVRREKSRAPVPYAEVAFVLDQQQKKAGGKPVPAYRVRWRGTGPEDDTWVVASRVKKAPGGPEAINEFEQKRVGAQAAPATAKKEHATEKATEKASSAKATDTTAVAEQPAAVAGKTERATGTSQKHQRDTVDAASAVWPKKKKSDTAPPPAAAVSGIATAVELRTGVQYSQMSSDQHELLDEFEQWQLTGQKKPPTEKTCKKYFGKFRKFVHTDYEDYDIGAKWNVCNKQKHGELMSRVKGSARNKKDHGECSAALAKFMLFLDARAQGWTSSKPVATRAGDSSDKSRGVQSGEQGQTKPSSKPLPKASAEERQKIAEEKRQKKEELQQLLEKNRLREERHAAKQRQRQVKRKDRDDDWDDDGDQAKLSPPTVRLDRAAAKSASSAAPASATEMERLHARMTSLPDTAGLPKIGAIPKKRRPAAAADTTDLVLEWQGNPVECDLCKSGIVKGRASRGAMVDGKIFCSRCLPAECRPARDAWAKAHRRGDAAGVPKQPADANARSSGHLPSSRPGSGASDGRNPGDARVAPPRPMKVARLCKFFNTPRGCFRGENCHFRHEECDRPEPARAARYAPGQHPDQIPHGQQHVAAERYAAEQQDGSGGPTNQIPLGAAQSTAFDTCDYGRDERTNKDTAKMEQAWSIVLMQDTVRRMDAMAHFPRGVLNHVISLKLAEALCNR